MKKNKILTMIKQKKENYLYYLVPIHFQYIII